MTSRANGFAFLLNEMRTQKAATYIEVQQAARKYIEIHTETEIASEIRAISSLPLLRYALAVGLKQETQGQVWTRINQLEQGGQ